MENKQPKDKIITVAQINQLLKQLVELPYKDSAMAIQILTTLKDIDNNNVNKVSSKDNIRDKT